MKKIILIITFLLPNLVSAQETTERASFEECQKVKTSWLKISKIQNRGNAYHQVSKIAATMSSETIHTIRDYFLARYVCGNDDWAYSGLSEDENLIVAWGHSKFLELYIASKIIETLNVAQLLPALLAYIEPKAMTARTNSETKREDKRKKYIQIIDDCLMTATRQERKLRKMNYGGWGQYGYCQLLANFVISNQSN